MTPETEKTTHHFWIYLNNYEGEDHNISRSLHLSLIEGFMEDKHIIEAQQKAMDEDPDFKLLAVIADAPLAHFRRTLDGLIAKEQAMKITAQAAAPLSVPAGG
jgi:vanillate O-demethylase monooxygenase subunit